MQYRDQRHRQHWTNVAGVFVCLRVLFPVLLPFDPADGVGTQSLTEAF
jgi:hypothetical protein